MTMSMLLAAGVLVAGTFALVGSEQGAPAPAIPFAVGQPFPDLLLPDAVDGRPRAIADFRGRKIVAHVFASW